MYPDSVLLKCNVQLNLKKPRESAQLLKGSNCIDVINIMLRFLLCFCDIYKVNVKTLKQPSNFNRFNFFTCSTFVFQFKCIISHLKLIQDEYIWSVDQRFQNMIPCQYFQYYHFILKIQILNESGSLSAFLRFIFSKYLTYTQ